jgi:predicted dehydrogenase
MIESIRNPVSIGIVGCGRFGRLHAHTLSSLAEAELVALVDSRDEVRRELAGEFPSVQVWEDLSTALAESDAEAWIVASSTAAHVSNAKAILEAGRKALVEKPLADDLAEAERLAPLVASDSSNLMAGHIVLFNSEFRELLAELPRRGPIAYIDAVRHRPRTTIDLFPGESPFYLTMVHDLYAVAALMQGAEPQRFSAQHRVVDGNCDLALAQLQWESGVIASLTASFLTPPGMAPDGFDRTEVFGHGWCARLQTNPRPIELWDSQARWPLALEIRDAPASGMLAEELRLFCRVVRGLEPTPRGARYDDAIQVIRWLRQLEEAAKSQVRDTEATC